MREPNGTPLVQYMVEAIVDRDSKKQEPLSERLARAIQSHIEAEQRALETYRELAATVQDPASRIVLQQVIADEEQQHGVFARIAAQLDYELSPYGRSPALPTDSARQEPDPAVGGRLAELARHELEDARRLRELARKSQEEYGGLLSLLLEAIATDSEKHERMLRFVRGRFRNPR